MGTSKITSSPLRTNLFLDNSIVTELISSSSWAGPHKIVPSSFLYPSKPDEQQILNVVSL